MAEIVNEKEFVLQFGQIMMKKYWGIIYQIVKANLDFVSVVPGFLIKPEKLIFYIGRTHIGIEYIGPEVLDEFPTGSHNLNVQYFDYSVKDVNIVNKIIGFEYNATTIALPLPPVSTDLILPTNAGHDELIRLRWNWAAQNMIVGWNTGGAMAPVGQFTRIVNGRFFDCDSSGLRTRHIKWLDLIPVKYDESPEESDRFTINTSFLPKLAEIDARTPYPVPQDYRDAHLPHINRFVELIGDKTKSEPEITSFLARTEYAFILMMRFGATSIHPERECEWQSSSNAPIKPDFFIVRTDGYADIVEFKLPEPKGSVVVGIANRETFSAEINSYISQTRVYREYFDDPNNRKWVEDKYGFKVYKPKRYIIIGRRWHLNSDEWKQIEADYTDLNILTYDDLIDGVVAQFYH